MLMNVKTHHQSVKGSERENYLSVQRLLSSNGAASLITSKTAFYVSTSLLTNVLIE